MARKIDLTGKKFGKLTVIREVEPSKSGRMWLCRCECGTEKAVLQYNLTQGKSTTCGCGKHLFRSAESFERVDDVSIVHLKQKRRSNNSTGHKGVTKYEQDGQVYYRATLQIAGKSHRCPPRKTLEEAVADRRRLEEVFHKPYLQKAELEKRKKHHFTKANKQRNLPPE